MRKVDRECRQDLSAKMLSTVTEEKGTAEKGDATEMMWPGDVRVGGKEEIEQKTRW